MTEAAKKYSMQTHHLREWFKQQRHLRQGQIWLRHHPEPDLLAARLMFHLNRHARSLFRSSQKRVIYRLKNLLVHHFYRAGYCRRVTLSEQVLTCWSCEATFDCYKCDDTGIYSRTILYQFKFQIADRTFIWHQPQRLVWWDVPLAEIDGGPGEYGRGSREPSDVPPALRLLYKYTLYAYLRDRGAPAYEPPVTIEDPDYGFLKVEETHTLPKIKTLRRALVEDIKFAISLQVAGIKDLYYGWKLWLMWRKRNIKRLIEFIDTGKVSEPEYKITEDEIPF